MQDIPLIVVPRQSLSIVLDGNRWGIRVYQSTGVMACDFTLNDEPLITGVRAVPQFQLLPYRYLQHTGGGNFAFITGANGTEYPWWENFDTSCTLVYASAAELKAMGAA